MHVVPALEGRQKKLLDACKELGSVKMAASMVKVGKEELEAWRQDPDFALALDISEGTGNADLYKKAMDALHANLDSNKLQAAEMVLQAVEPEKWSPTYKMEVKMVTHRFIDFNGKDLFENVIEGEFAPLPEPDPEA
jgi:hypothetical protein